MRERRYFLICFDSTRYEIDDFRWSGLVVAIGSRLPRYRLSIDDWFVIFDLTKSAVVGHGSVKATESTSSRIDVNRYEFRFSGAVARKKNHPLALNKYCLAFLRAPKTKRLADWKLRAVTQLSTREFNKIFECWWGVYAFSDSLPPLRSQ